VPTKTIKPMSAEVIILIVIALAVLAFIFGGGKGNRPHGMNRREARRHRAAIKHLRKGM